MLQALSLRPEMERQPACKPSVIIFRKGRLTRCEIWIFAAGQSFPAKTGANAFLRKTEERQ